MQFLHEEGPESDGLAGRRPLSRECIGVVGAQTLTKRNRFPACGKSVVLESNHDTNHDSSMAAKFSAA